MSKYDDHCVKAAFFICFVEVLVRITMYSTRSRQEADHRFVFILLVVAMYIYKYIDIHELLFLGFSNIDTYD